MDGRTLPLYKRPVDIVMCLLFAYYIWSCLFVERHYCRRELTANEEDPILQAAYEYSRDWNPLFLARPEWLRVATCISAYVLCCGYLVGLFTFILGKDSFRVPLLMFVSFKLYAISFYYYFEFFGEMAAPHVGMFLAADGPYLLGILLLLFRLRKPNPFQETSIKQDWTGNSDLCWATNSLVCHCF